MNVFYNDKYNISLGVFNFLHPFDGCKYKKIYESVVDEHGVSVNLVEQPVSVDAIERYVNGLMRRMLKGKRFILQALELPYLPLLPFSVIDKRLLEPMRWGVSGTLQASKIAISGRNCWNLSGGYHHASRSSAEGFCIYNDVGIAVDELRAESVINEADRILIIDVDAHHGNGNALSFMHDKNITILDVYNDDIYPQSEYTKRRVDINVPLTAGIDGARYLSALRAALSKLDSNFKVAFVLAGTDVLSSDPLGGFNLSMADCVERDAEIYSALHKLSIPAVFLGAGGYGPESASSVSSSIKRLGIMGC